MKRILFVFLSFLLVHSATQAQIPSGYYNNANGKKAFALKTALCAIITNGHTAVGYDNLWTVYATTDCRPDGCLWDMYSDMTNYPVNKPSGNYHEEGDVPNREHSFPKSWWGGSKSIQYSDVFHVVPADGYVNNRRSNLPFGETSNPTYSSHNGFSKVGPCDASIGYSGQVFEPNDEYKGDFARIYFYMATRYQNEIASWDCPMLAGNNDSVYTKWALTMLMRWAAEDPVSQKEIDRNNAVYKVQGNRNPFVDFPGLEQYVWGSKRGTALSISDYTEPDDPIEQPEAPSAPVFSILGGTVIEGTNLVIASPDNLNIHYSYDNENWQEGASPLTLRLTEDVSISAYCERKGLQSETVTYDFAVTPAERPDGTVFELISSTDDLEAGAYYLIVNESKQMALGEASKDVRTNVSVEINDHSIDLSEATSNAPTVLQLVSNGSYYAFFIPTEQAYLAVLSDANSLKTETSLVQGALWEISFSGTSATIKNVQYSDRSICYNSSSPRFATYRSTSRQQAVQLYRERETATGISSATSQSVSSTSWYTLDGRRLNAKPTKPGIYIVGGRKVVLK